MLLMIYRSEAYMEIMLPSVNNEDYGLLVDKKHFNIQKSFYIQLENINHSWFLNSTIYYDLSVNGSLADKARIESGKIFTVKSKNNEVVSIIAVDTNLFLFPFKKYTTTNLQKIHIGSGSNNEIQYKFHKLVSAHHCTINSLEGSVVVQDYSANGIFINGKRVVNSAKVSYGDVIEIFGLKVMLLDGIVAVGSCVEKFKVSGRLSEYKITVIENTDKKGGDYGVEYFNRSPRIIPTIDSTPVTIEAPATAKFKENKSLLYTVGPSLTMAIPMVLGFGIAAVGTMLGGSANNPFMLTGLITAVGSAVIGAAWAYFNIKADKQKEIDDEHLRFNMYSNYLVEMTEYIKKKYHKNKSALECMYPSAEHCCAYSDKSPELWNRNSTQSDFLFCRLGIGNIDFQINIDIPDKKLTMEYDALYNKPSLIAQSFKELRDVPVGVDFQRSSLFGIVGGKHKAGAPVIIDNILAQITSSLSYTDVKIAFCFSNDIPDSTRWEYVKWLPHTWSESKGIRYFASNSQEISDILYELSNVLRDRKDKAESKLHNTVKPHYLLFLYDVSMLEGELITKYIFDGNDYGFTTFVITDYYSNLPNECEHIISNDSNFKGYYSAFNSFKPQQIRFDSVNTASLKRFAKRIANIYVKEPGGDSSIAESLEFLDMYGVNTVQELKTEERWRKNKIYNSIMALVGKKAGGADCCLDIHERYYGPHGLIAGTTGSGKSELIQTLILSLAINYSPEDIAFLLIDFKGGGMANLFSKLPHLAGVITNLSGSSIRRAMVSIKSENLRRQKILNEHGVNSINAYTAMYKNGEAAVAIPHLFIIIDEFAELKKEEPEFMRELISVAQVGRSLGVHLVLATQKPNGTVDDNILSNAKFRLCLRVQDSQDSNEMLHKPDAAYITQVGRCYLQVGNDEIYELFQSGWSGAAYEPDGKRLKEEIATMLSATGKPAVVGNYTKKRAKEEKRNLWYGFLYRSIRSIKKELPYNDLDSAELGVMLYTLAKEVIVYAESKGFNIGESDVEISTVVNFINCMPQQVLSEEDAINYILEKASVNALKLPELRETTQLEAVVNYLSQQAQQLNFLQKFSLWLPPLKQMITFESIDGYGRNFNGTVWGAVPSSEISAYVGLYDDPQNQSQLPLPVEPTKDGHIIVCGSAFTGKSTFLQSLLFSLAEKYPPSNVGFYILDFGGGALMSMKGFPHTGGIITESNVDNATKLFTMLRKIIKQRKKLFMGASYTQYTRAKKVVMPALFLVIDNYTGFKEKTDNCFENIIFSIAREGAACGIYLLMSAAGFGFNDVPNKIAENIKKVFCLEMSDSLKYVDVLRRTHIDVYPEEGIRGRGVSVIEGRVLEFQTAVPIASYDDYTRFNYIASVGENMSRVWNGAVTKQIPFIPQSPTFEDLKRLPEYKSLAEGSRYIPIAYEYDSAMLYSIDLQKVYCYSITGKASTGKTNVLKIIMAAAAQKNAQCFVIETGSEQLKVFTQKCGFKYIDSCKEIINLFNSITPEFVARNKKKHSLQSKGMSEQDIFDEMSKSQAIYFFVSDFYDFINIIYHPADSVGNISGFFENILEKGYLHNIFFVSCIDTDKTAAMLAYKAYKLFTGYKTGIHMGGNLASQQIFSFSNVPFQQSSKPMAKGEGLVADDNDSNMSKKLIVPLLGGI